MEILQPKRKMVKSPPSFTKDCLAHKVNLLFDYTITTDKGVFNNPNRNKIVIETTKKNSIKIQKKDKAKRVLRNIRN